MADRMRTTLRPEDLELDKTQFQEYINKALLKIPPGSLSSRSASSKARVVLRKTLRDLRVLIGEDHGLTYSISPARLQGCFDQALRQRSRILTSDDSFSYTINSLNRDFYNDILGTLKKAQREDRTPDWIQMCKDAERICASAAQAARRRRLVFQSESRRLKESRQWHQLEKTCDYIQSLKIQLVKMGYRLSEDQNWRSLNRGDPYLDPRDIQALIDYLEYRIDREKKKLQHKHARRGRRREERSQWGGIPSSVGRSQGRSHYHNEDDQSRSNLGLWIRT